MDSAILHDPPPKERSARPLKIVKEHLIELRRASKSRPTWWEGRSRSRIRRLEKAYKEDIRCRKKIHKEHAAG